MGIRVILYWTFAMISNNRSVHNFKMIQEVDAAPKEANTSWSSSLNKMLKTESTSSQQDDEILEEQNLNPRNCAHEL